MDFKLGDCVVYPNNGLAVVENIEFLAIAGNPCSCYRLRLLTNGTTVVVPTINATIVGLRKTVGKRQALDVLDRLRDQREAAISNWKGRFKENSDRMRSGRLGEVADVLRDLSKLAEKRSLSFREKMMLERARDLVVSEIAAARGVAANEALDLVTEALLHR